MNSSMELAQEAKKPDKNRMTPRKKRTVAAACTAAVLMIAVIVILITALTSTPAGDNIYDNVYVGTVNVGGMTEAEAADAIEKGFSKYIQGKTVTLTHGEQSYEINVDTLNPVPDSKELAAKAMEVGRSGNIFKRFSINQSLKRGNKEVIPLTMALDENVLYSDVAYFGSTLLEADGIISFDYEKNEVTINTDKAKNTVDTDKVIKSIKTSINTGKFGKVEMAFTDTPDAEDCAELLYNLIVRDPVDAQMSYSDGKLEFVDEIDGIDIERDEIVKAVANGGTAVLPFTLVPAEVDKEALKQQAFSVTLASHTTTFDSGVVGRSNNIRKAAEKINGYIMMPGDEFSYNGVVGKRTIEAGFDYAGAYSGNKVVQEVGGGICQVSSTLYVAVLYSDLKVTKRYNHNLPVSYVPRGMDATVSYGGPDFCFVNSTDKPIMIKATVNGGTLYVSLVGFEKDKTKKVEIYTKTIATKNFVEETVVDPSVSRPTVVQNGVNGSTVETYKVVYVNGVEQSNRKIHTSTYQPENKIVHVPPQADVPPTQEAPQQPAETPPAGEATEPQVNDSPVEMLQ